MNEKCVSSPEGNRVATPHRLIDSAAPVVLASTGRKKQAMTLVPALIYGLALAACASTQPAVEVRIQRETVEVMRPCPVVVPVRPSPLTRAELPASAADALRIAIARLLEWQGAGGYGEQADAALDVCTRE